MNLSKPKTKLHKDKLLAAVHYICSKMKKDELGNVKLHKILYLADMFRFLESGQPLTGVEYIKQKMGPTARHLAWALRELEKSNKISISEENFHGYMKKNYISISEFKSNVLENEELKVLDDSISFLAGLSASEVSEISHNKAWELANMGEVIPYHSVYRLFATEIEPEDIRWAQQEIINHEIAPAG